MNYVNNKSVYGTQPTRSNVIPGTRAAALTLLALAVGAGFPAAAQSGGAYQVTNIISDGSVAAKTMDPNFINPWGISASPNW